MKKVKNMMTIIVILAVAIVSFASCDKDDNKNNEGTTPIEQDYFTIANAQVQNGAMPAATSSEPLAVTINRSALAGGSATVTIGQAVQEIYVGVKGLNNYYTISPSNLRAAAAETQTTFIIQFSQNLDESFQIQVAARLEDGSITTVYETSINYIEASTGGQGGLQVSLSFDALKDVDLYLITPDGGIIYYGNDGVWGYDENDEYVQLWGLDVDSNAGCSIDKINNENIFIPREYIVTGKYQVWVNMWGNCYPQDTPTNWVVMALQNGDAVPVTYGSNPRSGVFAVDEESNSIGASYYDGELSGATKVMEFNLQGSDQPKERSARATTKGTLSESAKLKLQIAGELH